MTMLHQCIGNPLSHHHDYSMQFEFSVGVNRSKFLSLRRYQLGYYIVGLRTALDRTFQSVDSEDILCDDSVDKIADQDPVQLGSQFSYAWIIRFDFC